MGRIIGTILGAILAVWLAVTAAGGIVATFKTFLIVGLIAMAVFVVVWLWPDALVAASAAQPPRPPYADRCAAVPAGLRRTPGQQALAACRAARAGAPTLSSRLPLGMRPVSTRRSSSRPGRRRLTCPGPRWMRRWGSARMRPASRYRSCLPCTHPALTRLTADKLAEKAHQLCPYSKATRGNVPVQVRAKV